MSHIYYIYENLIEKGQIVPLTHPDFYTRVSDEPFVPHLEFIRIMETRRQETKRAANKKHYLARIKFWAWTKLNQMAGYVQ